VSPAGQALLARELLALAPALAPYGTAAAEAVALLKWLLTEPRNQSPGAALAHMRYVYGRGMSVRPAPAARDSHEARVLDEVVTEELLRSVVEALRSQNAVLANHPNSAVYGQLQNLIEMDGYCLEQAPCLACGGPDVPYSQLKLSAVKAESKYTDNRILLRLVGTHSLQAMTLTVHSPRRSCLVRTVNLYYNNRPAELSDLANCWPKWHRAGTVQLTPGQTEATLALPLPVAACNLMVEFDAFYVAEQSAAQETLQCPRCSRAVTDRHGICRNCHENAYQCRQCRNINYEQLDAFLCNECGHSRYGRFDLSFRAKPSCEHAPVEGDAGVQAARLRIEAETEAAQRRFQQLAGFRTPILKLLQAVEENAEEPRDVGSAVTLGPAAGASSFRVNRNIAVLGVLYGEKCKGASDGVTRSMQAVAGARAALMEHLAPPRRDSCGVAIATLRTPTGCYGCASTFIAHALELLEALTAASPAWRGSLVRSGLPAELLRCNLHAGPQVKPR
jgi:E3 ubiquitin-protein ligase UBR4